MTESYKEYRKKLERLGPDEVTRLLSEGAFHGPHGRHKDWAEAFVEEFVQADETRKSDRAEERGEEGLAYQEASVREQGTSNRLKIITVIIAFFALIVLYCS